MSDLQRPLTPRGRKQARKMAKWIRKHAPDDLRILVSPALRCQQTAQVLRLPFETDPRLGPDRDVDNLLAVIDCSDSSEAKKPPALLVIAHQPTLGKTAAYLLSGEETSWSIKKGNMWWFDYSLQSENKQVALKSVIAPNFV